MVGSILLVNDKSLNKSVYYWIKKVDEVIIYDYFYIKI